MTYIRGSVSDVDRDVIIGKLLDPAFNITAASLWRLETQTQLPTHGVTQSCPFCWWTLPRTNQDSAPARIEHCFTGRQARSAVAIPTESFRLIPVTKKSLLIKPFNDDNSNARVKESRMREKVVSVGK